MTKNELIESIAIWNKLPKSTVATVINAFLDEIQTTMIEGGEVNLLGFGKFSVKEHKPRTGRNPRTGEEIQIPATKLPHFTAGKSLKEAVNHDSHANN